MIRGFKMFAGVRDASVSLLTAKRACGGFLLGAVFVVAGCGPGPTGDRAGGAAENFPTIVTSFSILDDIVGEVAGEGADVRLLAPVGVEVHEWELSPRNFIDLEEADIVFVNGLQLEQWMPQLEETVRDGIPVVRVAEESGYPTIPILLGEFEGDPDPHLWMDARAVMRYVEVIRDELSALNPDAADDYAANAGEYLEEIEALHEEILREVEALAPEVRFLVSSEAAFLYFADAYGFEHEGIWGSNAEEEGSPRQLARIIDLVNERRPAALFWESTISDRYVRSVSEETGVPFAGPLYVDSLGAEGSGAETYGDMMRENLRLLVETLGGETD